MTNVNSWQPESVRDESAYMFWFSFLTQPMWQKSDPGPSGNSMNKNHDRSLVTPEEGRQGKVMSVQGGWRLALVNVYHNMMAEGGTVNKGKRQKTRRRWRSGRWRRSWGQEGTPQPWRPPMSIHQHRRREASEDSWWNDGEREGGKRQMEEITKGQRKSAQLFGALADIHYQFRG